MDWTKGWRDRVWGQLNQDWDVIIIGGGISGAGIFRQCVQAKLKTLLVEGDDFASGTSSRSSKLVHGGMRYLKNAQVRVTLESVTEREQLLKQGRGLINRLSFLYPCLPTDSMPGWIFGMGLGVYDLMAHQWSHRSYDSEDMRELCPLMTVSNLQGGYRFFDAQTDDARLVLRLLREAGDGGGSAINYARVTSLLKTNTGRVCGVVLSDTSGEAVRQVEIKARVVVNATGAWGDDLRKEVGKNPRLRPLRGSHLVLPVERLPLTRTVSFLHPRDGRPTFALPWEGTIIYGTTDVDHTDALATDPSISSNEAEYLLEGLKFIFPGQQLGWQDVRSTFSGIRPVVNTGKANPSKESREHVLWDEDGLITVSGGKLTTFRIMARQTLKAISKRIGKLVVESGLPMLDPIPQQIEADCSKSQLTPQQCLRLLARYGSGASSIISSKDEDLRSVEGTISSWAEIRHAIKNEAVIHLDDLLLRRVRLGLLAPEGGAGSLEKIGIIFRQELGWDSDRWAREKKEYLDLWQKAYHCV